MIYVGQEEREHGERFMKELASRVRQAGRRLPHVFQLTLRTDDFGDEQMVEFWLVQDGAQLRYETADPVELAGVPASTWRIDL